MKDLKTCIRGFLRMSRPMYGRMVAYILIGCANTALSLCFVWICKRLVDIVTGHNAAPLGTSVVLLAAIMLGQLIVRVASQYYVNYNTVRTQNELRLSYFSHVLYSRWNGRETFRSGDAVNRLQEDVRILTDLICNRVPGVIITILQLVASSVYLPAPWPLQTQSRGSWGGAGGSPEGAAPLHRGAHRCRGLKQLASSP